MKKFLKFIAIFSAILIVLLALLVFSLIIIMNCMKKASASQRYYDRGISIVPTSDYILVPGAKINLNTPSDHLQHRLDYAYLLYKNEKAPKIIVSGGFDEEVKKYEPEVMRSYLIRLGVKSEDIISDLKGDNTFATLKRTKEFVGNKSVIYCVQELYSYRAFYIAKHLKLNMTIFCSDPVIYSHTGKNTVREHLAQAKAILNCSIFKPNVPSISDFNFIYENEANKNEK